MVTDNRNVVNVMNIMKKNVFWKTEFFNYVILIDMKCQ